jgi:quinol monooxygenase YgiN
MSDMSPSVPELTLVVITLNAADPAALAAVVSTYVIAARAQPGCRNVDFCQAVGIPGRFVIIEKWVSPEAQATHFGSRVTEDFARSCRNLLSTQPSFELLESVSAHDLA